MGMIKLPKNSINFFKDNQNKIFESGNLAEGPWNEKLSDEIKSICNVENAICVNSTGSGLVALLLIYKEYIIMKETWKNKKYFQGTNKNYSVSKVLREKKKVTDV